MSRFLITALAEGHTGDLGVLRFVDGQAEADSELHAAEIAYCRSVGHRVEPIDGDPFDPSRHPVTAVIAHLEQADADEHARVLAAEADGKARATILAITPPEVPQQDPAQDPTQQGADQ